MNIILARMVIIFTKSIWSVHHVCFPNALHLSESSFKVDSNSKLNGFRFIEIGTLTIQSLASNILSNNQKDTEAFSKLFSGCKIFPFEQSFVNVHDFFHLFIIKTDVQKHWFVYAFTKNTRFHIYKVKCIYYKSSSRLYLIQFHVYAIQWLIISETINIFLMWFHTIDFE